MSLSDVLMEINKGYSLSDLTQLSEDNFKEFYPYTGKDFKSYSELKEYLTPLNMSADKIYFNTSMMNNCWYIDRDVIVCVSHLVKFYLDMFTPNTISTLKRGMEEYKENNEWDLYLSRIPKEFQVSLFKDLMAHLPEDKLLETFISIYTSNDQVISTLSKQDILEFLPKGNYTKELDKYVKYKDGLITVYRGSTEKSTPIEEALSFTLDMNVAKRFALCANYGGGVIYKCKVKPEDVLLLVSEEGECEVLVDYDDLIYIEEINILNYSYLDEVDYLYTDVRKYLTFCKGKKGIHGVSHSKRMLKLLCCMYNEMSAILSYDDFNLLALACCLHDIGRLNDGKDDYHGKRAIPKVREIIKDLNISDEDSKILETLIQYHPYKDRVAKKLINSDDYRVNLLFNLFKDLDGLDRVRTHDFDIKYLRHDVSFKLVGIAKYLFKVYR